MHALWCAASKSEVRIAKAWRRALPCVSRAATQSACAQAQALRQRSRVAFADDAGGSGAARWVARVSGLDGEDRDESVDSGSRDRVLHERQPGLR